MCGRTRWKESPWMAVAFMQSVIFLFIVISAVSHNASFTEPIRLFAYQLFFWLVVGFVALKISGIQTERLTEIITLSYAFGGIISLITYIICMVTIGRTAVMYVSILEVTISIWYLFRNRVEVFSRTVSTEGFFICLFFLTFFYLLATAAVSFVNTFPDETGGTGYYLDWPFWVGNNIAFTKEFPCQNFRLVGKLFKYHYFSSILMANAALSTELDVVRISFYYSYIFSGLLLILSADFLCSRLLKNKWYIFSAIFSAVFTDGLYVVFSGHTLICPFGFDYGYAYGMLALAALIELVKNNRWRDYFGLSILAIAMTTGCKGPCGLIILVGFGVTSFWYIGNRQYKKGLVSGFAWLSAFLLVFFIFINSPSVTASDAVLSIVPLNPVAMGIYNRVLVSNWAMIIPYPKLLLFLTGIYYVYKSNMLMTILVLMISIKLVRDICSKRIDPILFILFSICVAGIAGVLFTSQEHKSETYFLMTVFPAVSVSGAYVIENEQKRILRIILIVIAIVFLAGSSELYFDRTGLFIRDGIHRMDKRIDSSEEAHYRERVYTLFADNEDYEAFRWLRDHTDINDVVAVDSFVESHGRDNSLLAGIFSERYIWNESKYSDLPDESARRNTIVDLLTTNPEESIKQMRAENVSYILHAIEKTEAEGVLDKIGSLINVFQNKHYIIYKIIRT